MKEQGYAFPNNKYRLPEKEGLTTRHFAIVVEVAIACFVQRDLKSLSWLMMAIWILLSLVDASHDISELLDSRMNTDSCTLNLPS